MCVCVCVCVFGLRESSYSDLEIQNVSLQGASKHPVLYIFMWFNLHNLRRCNWPNSNHQKTIIMAQIIAFGNFENYGSIKSMKKSILLFIYLNFPNILLVAPKKYYCLRNLIIVFNINFSELWYMGNGKVLLHFELRSCF